MKPRHSVRWIVGFLGIAWQATAGEVTVNQRHFMVPEGFTVELVASPPLVQRPITADFDEAGNLYVSDSSGSADKPKDQLEKKPHRILKLSDSKGSGVFDRSTVFADHMMFPEGTLWVDGSLYVAAPPSIWKLTDTSGRGIADQRTEWFAGKTLTGCANDLHGPYLGLDGWIYWCKGAFAEQTYERPGGKPFVTRAAHLFRARPDGSNIEPVMTGGMDNPVEITFTPGGERIFSSTFIQNPANGKRDGIAHAIYGGIYGKINNVVDDHPHTFPEVMPILVNTGPAAECALTRYEGTAFGKDFQDNLFASSFNLHKVTRHVLTEDGATFKSIDSDFLTCDSLDFHPTHLLEDADGSLLVIDTGGWYKLCCPTSQLGKPDVLGAIYRVRRIEAKPPKDPRGLKIEWNKLRPEDLCGLLSDARVFVRRRAIAELAKHGDSALRAIAEMKQNDPVARLNAVWAATRIPSVKSDAFCRTCLKDKDATVVQAAAHSASVRRDREATPILLELLSSDSPQHRRVAAEALGRIGDPRAVAPLLAALEKPIDHVLEHSLVYALIEIGDGKSTAAGLNHANPHVRRGAMMATDQMTPRAELSAAVVAREMSATDVALRETASWIAARHPEWGDSLAGAMQSRLEAGDFITEETTQLQLQLAKLAKSPAIQTLLARCATSSGQKQQIALAAIGQSGIKPLPVTWVDAFTAILGGQELSAIRAAAAAISRMPTETATLFSTPLLAAASNSGLPNDVRLEALSAVARPNKQISPQLFHFVLEELATDGSTSKRVSASNALRHSTLNNQQLLELVPLVRTAGPLSINDLLDLFEQSTDEQIGIQLIAALREAKSAKSLRVDQIKSRLAKFGPKIQQAADDLIVQLNPDSSAQKAKLDSLLATLPSGDIRRGQTVFNSAKVACVTCHSIGYLGGHVGPDLTRIGSVRAERDLLESIIYPSASFAQTFEPYTAWTKNGDRFDGILRRNDAEEVMLVTGPDHEVHIPRGDVKELNPGTLSIMPSGLDQQLAPQELADLVAFLKACK